MQDKVISLYARKAPGDNAAWTMKQCLEYALQELQENPEMEGYEGGMVIFYKKTETGFRHRTLTANLPVEVTLALLSTELHQTIAGD